MQCTLSDRLLAALRDIKSLYESDPDDLETMDAGIKIIDAAIADANFWGERSLLPWRAALTVVENQPETWGVYTPRTKQRFNGECVAICAKQADAEFITRACNVHDGLLAACKAILSLIGDHDVATMIAEQFSHPDVVNKAIDDAEAAIAKAEAE